jgi:hypothetical protein
MANKTVNIVVIDSVSKAFTEAALIAKRMRLKLKGKAKKAQVKEAIAQRHRSKQ